jgi:ABC-type multidrug transport system fused ATPase/permease subunit
MLLNSIIFFLKKSFQTHPKKFLFLIFLIILDSIFVMTTFIAVVPFAEFLIDPTLVEPNKLTYHLKNIFRYLNLEINYLSLSIFLVSTIIFSSIITLIIIKQIYKIKFDYELTLTKDLMNSILNCKWKHLSRLKQGKILNIFTKEVDNVGNTIRGTAQIFANFFKLLIYLFVPFYINSIFTLKVTAAFLIICTPFLYLNNYAKKIGLKRSLATNQELDKRTETYSALKLILGFNLSKKIIKNNILLTLKVIEQSMKAITLSYIVPLAFKPIAIIIILIIFGSSFNLNKIPEYVGIFWGLYGAIPIISALVGNTILASNFHTSLRQVEKVINECRSNVEANTGINFLKIKKEIKFEKVNFYHNKTNPILKDLSISIPKNQVTTFIGRTGEGKSTIIDLILGLQKSNSGEIFFDDNLISNLNVKSLREAIGYVPQDPLLFNTSIRENIKWANQEISDNEIFSLLNKINALDFVNKSKNKLDTLVGERGLKISGGQRQKIALARALAKKPEILILDEGLSSIDTESSNLISKYLREISKNMTIINVTHEISQCKYSDKIVLLENKESKVFNDYSDIKFI